MKKKIKFLNRITTIGIRVSKTLSFTTRREKENWGFYGFTLYFDLYYLSTTL